MILDSLVNISRYQSLHHRFEKAIKFLADNDLAKMDCGRYEISGDDIYAVVVDAELRKKEVAFLEVHDKYIDIQVVVSGVEGFGWGDRRLCDRPKGKFDVASDIMFFDDRVSTYFDVCAGNFVVFFADDAHAPLVGDGRVKKVILKVKI